MRRATTRMACGFAAALSLGFATLPALAQETASRIDGADTAWMIAATALVLMMTVPGLALFYCGMVRKKNVLGTMAPSLLCTMLCSLLWAAFVYSLVFADGGPLIGSLDRALLRGIGLDTVAPQTRI